MSTSPGTSTGPGSGRHTTPRPAPNLGDGKAARGSHQSLGSGPTPHQRDANQSERGTNQSAPPSHPAPTGPKATPGHGGVTPGRPGYGTGTNKQPPPPAPKPPAPKPPPTLTNSQQSIYDLMAATLKSWGLSSLGADLKNLILKGDTSPDTLALALSQTQAYKTRFAGNELRVKNGLSELTPAQYLATEEQYQNVLQAYGLPKGFYDQHSDFTNFIGKGISPAELQARAQVAHDQFTAAPPETRALWQKYFGTQGDAIASILDPDVATQLIQDRGQQVALGGAAAQQGFGVNQQRAQQFQQAGVSLAQAQKAYSQLAQTYGTDQSIAKRFGTTFDQTQEENDLLLGQGDAAVKRATLYDEEKSLFKGGPATSSEGIGVSQSY